MASIGSLPSIDSSTLLGFMNERMALSSAQRAVTPSAGSSSNSSASALVGAAQPPWDTPSLANSPARDAQVLAATNFIDLDSATLTNGGSSSAKAQEDNEKLFALYQGVNQLYYLASMAQRSTMTAGQLTGFNTRFQAGLSQIESFVNSTSFNNLSLQAGHTSASVTSSVNMPIGKFGYTGGTIVSDAGVGKPLANVTASDSFTIAITKGGTSTNVPIDLSRVQGPLTVDNIVGYVNQQLAADGFDSRFSRTITQGSIADSATASYGIRINPTSGETVALSSTSATPALYVAGTTGMMTPTTTNTSVNGTTSISTTPPDGQGSLVKLTDLSGAPTGVFKATTSPGSGTTAAQSTAVDQNGNVYIIGNATGDFGNELNQGTQDAYLAKYDSAGNLQWTKLLGSSGSASGYSLALNPNGGVVIAGSTTADLVTGAVADGNTDSFASEYDGSGNQVWVTQIQTLANNQAASVSVDTSGNVYVGGQVSGVIGAGQQSAGGSDAYVTKLNSSGKIVSEQQFGTSGNDSVAATAVTADGGLVIASKQNGDAILSKYAGGDMTSAPEWTIDLGSLQNGSLGSLAVSGNQIYLSGSTANAALTADGQASVANASSGGTNGFVFAVTDQGSSATPNTISYVGASGPGASTRGNALTVGPDGTVYLAGTTTGTFAGQTRNVANVNNMYVAALSGGGAINWVNQFGGVDGQSTGQGIAIDPTGSSVLDALGLPRGTLNIEQSVDLASQTTLKPGDSFHINVEGAAARNSTVTVAKGETLQSLVAKINDSLLFNGKATVTYGSDGEALKIAVNPGATATLVAGPTDFDGLARLGIPAGALTAPAKSSSASSASPGTSGTLSAPSTTKQVFGLGLTGRMNISTSSGAGAAHAELGNVLSAIRSAYTATNSPPSSNVSTQASPGPVPAYLSSQLANYNLGLSLFIAGSSGGTIA